MTISKAGSMAAGGVTAAAGGEEASTETMALLPQDAYANTLRFCDPSVLLSSPELLEIWKTRLPLSADNFSESFQKRYFSEKVPHPQTSEVLNDLFQRACRVGEETKFTEIISEFGCIEDKIDRIDTWVESIRIDNYLSVLTDIMKSKQEFAFLDAIKDSSKEDQIEKTSKWLKENSTSFYIVMLMHMKLREVPKELGRLRALKSLHLEGNQLREVPKELGRLRALERLYLGDNQLREVPKELGQLRALRELDLQNNQLETLPPEFCKLHCFPEINGNPIIYLPSQLIPKAPEEYKDYAFNLDKDLAALDGNFGTFPIRLQTLIKRLVYEYYQRNHPEKFDSEDPDFGGTMLKRNAPEIKEAISWAKEKLIELKTLRDSAISNNDVQGKLRTLIEMMHFPTDKVLFDQQIAEAIIEVAKTLPSGLQAAIGCEVEKVCDLDPGEGFEKFTFRPLDLKEAVTALTGS